MTSRLATPLEFPHTAPDGFVPLPDEPVFDAARHLQIERPSEIVPLSALGYDDATIAECPTGFGLTSIFRVLSDDGVAALLHVVDQLEAFTTSNARIARNVRGGVYRSRFLRDLCQSQVLTDAMSEIAGTPLLPHTLPHQLGHLNYNPLEVGQNVDKWHVDTLRIDFVLFVTDPNAVEGGEFEYYKGTKAEVEALTKAGQPMDPDKICAPQMPGPGYAVLQQGNMVVHRAKGLRAPGRRITMVNGYVPRDTGFPDFSRFDQLSLVDPARAAAGEYARHVAWMGRERLAGLIDGVDFSRDATALADDLEALAQLLHQGAEDLRKAGQGKVEHFGDG